MSSNLGGNFGGGFGTTVDGIIQPFDLGQENVRFECFPGTVQAGRTVALTLTGTLTAWDGTTTIAFASSAGITLNSLLVFSATSATANITTIATAALTARTITMTTGAQVDTLEDAFTITERSANSPGGFLPRKKKSGATEAAPVVEWQPRPADKAYLQRKKYSL